MQYTNYFSFVAKENGTPQLNNYSFRRMMNIIYLEGVIRGLNKAKESNKGSDQYYRYDVLIFRENKRLCDLTGNIQPADLFKEMIGVNQFS